ncbi:MAG TPA: hypothetical protein VEF76_02675 [Patescibacteria group bacterium]|nr:hypothetical protein [Patescibacteria group bacterium]
MMFRYAVFVLFCAAFAPRDAGACRYRPEPLEQSIKSAEKSFIGTVKTVENGMAYIEVEQTVHGVKEGDVVEAEYRGNSCDIRFAPGQRWLYLGSSLPSGSLLLQDENGRELAGNIAATRAQLGGAPAGRGGMQRGGTIEVSCAPWDGAAYTITLDNGVVAHVYDSLSVLEKLDGQTTLVIPADGQKGHGAILVCATGTVCQRHSGTITLGGIDRDTAYGRIDILDGEHNIRHVFRVKRMHKEVFCG